jgi:hypothetical protein
MTGSSLDHDLENGDLVEATEATGPDTEGVPHRMRGRLQIRHVDALGYDRYSIEGMGVEPSTIRRVAEIEPTLSSETQVADSFRARGDVVVQFQYMTHPPFDATAKREELRQRLAAIGADVPANRLNGRPAFPLSVLERPESFEAFIGILEWFVDEAVLPLLVAADSLAVAPAQAEDPAVG